MSLYNPSKYEDRSKDIADHVRSIKDRRNKTDDTKDIGSSDNDRKMTSKREISMLTI